MCDTPFVSIGELAPALEDDIEDIAGEHHLKLKKGTLIPEIKREAYTNFLMDLYNSENTNYDKMMKPLSKKYKLNPKRNALSHLYRSKVFNEELTENMELEQFLITKKMRSQSGVIVVAVIMAPGKFSCAEDCHYCPNFPGISRSYIPDEPTVERGRRNKFDATCQFMERITTYFINGHPLDKVELIIKGGTFSCYPRDYQREFMRDLYYAANTTFDDLPKRPKRDLEQEILLNEDALVGIIGMTIETRPDYITRQELQRLRSYGVTRVELGVQHTDENILRLINRGHTIEESKHAIKMLKDNCFKVDIHLMPDLPGSSLKQDKQMFDKILSDPDTQADQWKIYPTETTDHTTIKEWYDHVSRNALIIQRHIRGYFCRKLEGRGPAIPEFSAWDYDRFRKNSAWYLKMVPQRTVYKVDTLNEGDMFAYIPYAENKEMLIDLAIYVKTRIHRYIRINRFIRDFPETLILGGNPTTNLRQVIHDRLKECGKRCNCIRCREVKLDNSNLHKARLTRQNYDSSGGKEVFLSYTSCHHDFCWKWVLFCILSYIYKIVCAINVYSEEEQRPLSWYGCGSEDTIYGFLRLRLSSESGTVRKFSKMDKNISREYDAFPELKGCALLRELHVYGQMVAHYDKKRKAVPQHSGFGRKLIKEAERISRGDGYGKMAVISGVGVRNYYRRFGFDIPDDNLGDFLIKKL